jgi:hypothetical protein
MVLSTISTKGFSTMEILLTGVKDWTVTNWELL